MHAPVWPVIQHVSTRVRLPRCDAVQELAWRLCANPTEIAPTLLAAFEQPGSEEATTAAAAAAQTCYDDVTLGIKFLDEADENTNATRLQRCENAWHLPYCIRMLARQQAP